MQTVMTKCFAVLALMLLLNAGAWAQDDGSQFAQDEEEAMQNQDEASDSAADSSDSGEEADASAWDKTGGDDANDDDDEGAQ